MSKTNQPKGRKENGPKVKHNVSTAGEFTPEVNESIKKIISKAKEIQAENKQYKSKIAEIKKALYEAAILNINYGKVVSLLVNETTTKEEKASIVERFSNVKTINEGTQLYDTIKRELNETKKGAPIVERTIPNILLRVTRSRRSKKAKTGANTGWVLNIASAMVGEAKL
jgi:hypothetical protein